MRIVEVLRNSELIVEDGNVPELEQVNSICQLPPEQLVDIVAEEKPGLVEQMQKKVGGWIKKSLSPVDPSDPDSDKKIRSQQIAEHRIAKLSKISFLHVELGYREMWPDEQSQRLFEVFAKSVCELCPISRKEACLEQSRVNDADSSEMVVQPGIWAGMNAEQRANYFKRRDEREN